MKKIYVKPETMVICTEPVIICAGSPQTGWNNDGDHQGGVGDGDFDPNDPNNWGGNN